MRRLTVKIMMIAISISISYMVAALLYGVDISNSNIDSNTVNDIVNSTTNDYGRGGIVDGIGYGLMKPIYEQYYIFSVGTNMISEIYGWENSKIVFKDTY